jgi:serine/threonine-protein kinase
MAPPDEPPRVGEESAGAGLLTSGAQLDSRYEVVRLIGRGAMAAVYLVRHLGLHSEHALKVLNPEFALDPDLRSRFVAEGRIQAKLSHPNIVHVTEIVTNPVAGLVMDYVEGPSLDEHLRRLGRAPSLDEVLSLMLPVLDAVQAAHQFGVVHRDLKPENILVGLDPHGKVWPRVTDFGIAKVAGEQVGAPSRRTQAGTRMGTLLYMSPEQVRGSDSLDGRSDIFALGAILYEVVTGKVAFDAPSEFDTMKHITEGEYVPAERVVGGLPPALAATIRKALAVAPEERFADCAEFRAALLETKNPAAVPVAKPTRSFAVTSKPEVVSAANTPDLPEGPTFGRARPRDLDPRLLVHIPDGTQTEFFLLEGRSTVGRNPGLNALCLPDRTISPQHAAFTRKGTEVVLTDMNSLSGVFINDRKIAEARLKSGDQIRLGNCSLTFLIGSSANANVTSSSATTSPSPGTNPNLSVSGPQPIYTAVAIGPERDPRMNTNHGRPFAEPRVAPPHVHVRETGQVLVTHPQIQAQPVVVATQGKARSNANAAEQNQVAMRVASHLGFALFTTLFCCMPLGLVAVGYALGVGGKRAKGRWAEAKRASNRAATWAWLAFGAGSAFWWWLIHQFAR